MYWILFKVVYSFGVIDSNAYEVSNGDYLLSSDGNLVNRNEDKIKEPITVIVYKSIDPSQPYAIVSKDKKKVLVLDDNGNIIAKDTSLFINFEKYGILCLMKKNTDQPMCKALSHALDPSDVDEKKEEDEEKEEKEPKKGKKEEKSETKFDFKDLESDVAEVSGISFSDSFIWNTDIADNEGSQRIINVKNKLCLAVVEGKLEMRQCDKTLPGQGWKFHTYKKKSRKRKRSPEVKGIIKVQRTVAPLGSFLRPAQKVVVSQPSEEEEEQVRTNLVNYGGIKRKREVVYEEEEKTEDSNEDEKVEHKRKKAKKVKQNFVGNPPLTQQIITETPVAQQSIITPQPGIFTPPPYQMVPQQGPFNPFYNQQQVEGNPLVSGPPFFYNLAQPPIHNPGLPVAVNVQKQTESVKTISTEKKESKSSPPSEDSDSKETSEPPKKTNEDKNNEVALETIPNWFGGGYSYPFGPTPPISIVNNTTTTKETKKEEKKKGGLGGLIGGLAKSSPIGAALGG